VFLLEVIITVRAGGRADKENKEGFFHEGCGAFRQVDRPLVQIAPRLACGQCRFVLAALAGLATLKG
jgi:hypothetical protein